MRLYIANRFSLREETRQYAEILKGDGHTITSSWVYGGEEGLSFPNIAVLDTSDVESADALVRFTQPWGTMIKGGGRMAETGMAIAWKKRVFLVGPRQQIFDWHPLVLDFPEFDHLRNYLRNK